MCSLLYVESVCSYFGIPNLANESHFPYSYLTMELLISLLVQILAQEAFADCILYFLFVFVKMVKTFSITISKYCLFIAFIQLNLKILTNSLF